MHDARVDGVPDKVFVAYGITFKRSAIHTEQDGRVLIQFTRQGQLRSEKRQEMTFGDRVLFWQASVWIGLVSRRLRFFCSEIAFVVLKLVAIP